VEKGSFDKLHIQNPALKTQILLTHCPIYIVLLQLKGIQNWLRN